MIHPEGRVDPAADMETIETELVYADLEQAERRHVRVVREARGGDKAAVAEEAWLAAVIDALQRGEPARTVPVPAAAPAALRNLSPLTGKPVLYVANVDEGDDAVPSVVADHAAAVGAAAVAVSSRIEAELSELDDEEAAVMREELGVGETGLDRVVRGAFGLLDLIAFFTAGEDKPAQSWHMRRGLTAWHAAGSIHSDIQRGFVRAEVIAWDALVDAGGYAAGARARHAAARGPRLRDGRRRRHHRQVHALACRYQRGDGRQLTSPGARRGGLGHVRAELLRSLRRARPPRRRRRRRRRGARAGRRASTPDVVLLAHELSDVDGMRCSTGCAPTTTSRRSR